MPRIEPRYVTLTHGTPNRRGIVRYNILADGLCIEDSKCPLWDLENKMQAVIDAMGTLH